MTPDQNHRTTKILIIIAAAALLTAGLISVRSTHAQSPDPDWRPPITDQIHTAVDLTTFDAKMAPTLAALQPSIDAILADMAVITSFTSIESIATTRIAVQNKLDAVDALLENTTTTQELATKAIQILRDNPAKTCWNEYAATQIAGWLLIGDGTQSLIDGATNEINAQMGSGIYLLTIYGTLVHDLAIKECEGTS